MIADFRSDTVTQPSAAMRTVMAEADVGDDVFADDPSVNALESKVAALLGKEAAVFVPTGTQSNLVGLLAHCGRGDEYIVGQNAHCYKYEAGGAAVLGSIQPQPIEMNEDGSLSLDVVASKIKPDDSHFARTRLLAIENTHDGKLVAADYLASLRPFADDHGLALHLDGARLWNACAASQQPPAALAAAFDTVSVCFSKGLGAPVGSALVGSKPLIDSARKWRKMLGGGMRQAGVLAAAASYALDHHRERMTEDHVRARTLAEGLTAIPGFSLAMPVESNMVFLQLDHTVDPVGWQEKLAANNVRVLAGPTTRLVTHLGIDDTAVETIIGASS